MSPQSSWRPSRLRGRYPNAIREYRLKAGLTQRRLGKLVGRSRNLVSDWERGLVLPDVPRLLRLARVLDTLAEGLYFRLYHPKDEGTEQNA